MAHDGSAGGGASSGHRRLGYKEWELCVYGLGMEGFKEIRL